MGRKSSIAAVCALAAAMLIEGCAGGMPEPASAAASPTTLDSAAMLRLARAARSAGDYPSAINLYRQIAAGSGGPAVTAELGDTLLDAGSIDEAITAYESVPSTSPAALNATLGLEHAYVLLDELPKAAVYADKARAIAPDDPRTLVDRGIALDLVGRHGEAQASYRSLLAKAPANRAARVDLALSLALTGHCQDAMTIIDPIARSSTATPRERQDLALILGLMGNESEARRWSLIDLGQTATAANLRFFDYVKSYP